MTFCFDRCEFFERLQQVAPEYVAPLSHFSNFEIENCLKYYGLDDYIIEIDRKWQWRIEMIRSLLCLDKGFVLNRLERVDKRRTSNDPFDFSEEDFGMHIVTNFKNITTDFFLSEEMIMYSSKIYIKSFSDMLKAATNILNTRHKFSKVIHGSNVSHYAIFFFEDTFGRVTDEEAIIHAI